MAHVRSNIRETFLAALKGKTAAGDKIYDSRLYNVSENELPAIIIFAGNEQIVTSTISYPRTQDRTLKVTVECYVQSTLLVSTIIDNMAADIEQLVLTNLPLKRLCKDCRLESTDISLNSSGDQPVAVASLVFTVSYRTKENSPEIII
jgi:hypothetical protein